LPGRAKITAKKGGRFQWDWNEPEGLAASGTFLEIAPRHRASFTWETPNQRTVPSEVIFAAEATPYGALVSLEHRGGARGFAQQEFARLWPRLLERLRAYFLFGRKIRVR
jgi:uncharacterized protein YndB with AHSA1/START domain